MKWLGMKMSQSRPYLEEDVDYSSIAFSRRLHSLSIPDGGILIFVVDALAKEARCVRADQIGFFGFGLLLLHVDPPPAEKTVLLESHQAFGTLEDLLERDFGFNTNIDHVFHIAAQLDGARAGSESLTIFFEYDRFPLVVEGTAPQIQLHVIVLQNFHLRRSSEAPMLE